MLKVSVIVPVYNVEQYLRRCLDSILCQTFSDFELIVVDDGSSDSSGQICDEYAEKDKRIIVIHQSNAGVSAARNKALCCAKGEWVIFIDADDYISSDYIMRAKACNSDLVIMGYDDGTMVQNPKVGKYNLACDDNIIFLFNNFNMLTVWAKIYQMSIIKDHSIFFNESLAFGEDTLFNNTYIKYSSSAQSISYAGYYHTIDNKQSLSSNAFNQSLVTRSAYIQEIFDEWSSNLDIQKFWASRFLWNAENSIKKIVKSNCTLKEKREQLRSLISNDLFQKCYALTPLCFSKVNGFFIKHKLYLFLILRYQ